MPINKDKTDTYLSSLEISEKISLEIKKNPQKFICLTGDRPTGHLHIGHYFGSIVERIRLQNEGVKTYLLIADLQVITDRQNTENIQKYVYSNVLDYLAAGIDPKKTIIFTHSAVAALNELFIPFLSLVSDGELTRNPTVKSELQASSQTLSGLLLTYPVHQAADILFCKANVVPVGKDQLPHIELARTLARRFNERYESIFPEPYGLLTNAPLIPGLDGRKMSKSYNNSIQLSYTEEQTIQSFKKAKSDSERKITYNPETRPEISSILTTAALTSNRTPEDIAKEINEAGAGVLKDFAAKSVNNYFQEFRQRRLELSNNLDYVKDIIAQGNKQANIVAEQTLEEVKNAMGLKY
ncbi:MAG: tryptophan--tRNA ligase [Bifidobacteriaceae bacterium]|jgi:tryptophanyl-tRNA synthetase|nr:tryptophan--tRNA ligase [Bifidobacteriaceae bacterium]